MDSMSVIACPSGARISTAGLWESANSKMPGLQGANLFFMNPAGVLFGRHAQLDVSGSVAVTTANYLNLVGGGRFNANLGGGDVLTSAPVSAFGFLNSAPKGVSIIGSNRFDSNFGLIASPVLNIATGRSFSIVAGDIV